MHLSRQRKACTASSSGRVAQRFVVTESIRSGPVLAVDRFVGARGHGTNEQPGQRWQGSHSPLLSAAAELWSCLSALCMSTCNASLIKRTCPKRTPKQKDQIAPKRHPNAKRPRCRRVLLARRELRKAGPKRRSGRRSRKVERGGKHKSW